MERVHSTFSGPGKSKTLRGSEVYLMEKELYKWFLAARENNIPIDGKLLKEKSKMLHKKIYPNKEFKGSDGWLANFKKRYGICLLKITGEKLSSKAELVAPFLDQLASKIRMLKLCPEQIYNADESSLYWKLLPSKTFVSSNEKNAPGRKVQKERITFLACANATGNHKLRPLIIGKSKTPRSFKNFTLPVDYDNSKTAWMTSFIFKSWFEKKFVPQVRVYLKEKGLEPKALLLLDNAPCHPSADSLISDDGKVITLFMPPNVTALIQPMDQNVIRLTKLRYRNSLLSSLIAKQPENFETYLKGLTLRDAASFLSYAWDSLESEPIKKCFNNILRKCYNDNISSADDCEDSLPLAVLQRRLRATDIGFQRDISCQFQALVPTQEFNQTEISSADDSEDCLPLAVLQRRLRTTDIGFELDKSIQFLQALAPTQEFNPADINDWNNDPVQEEQIDLILSDSSDDEPEVIQWPKLQISHAEAITSLNKIIQWTEENGIDYNYICEKSSKIKRNCYYKRIKSSKANNCA